MLRKIQRLIQKRRGILSAVAASTALVSMTAVSCFASGDTLPTLDVSTIMVDCTTKMVTQTFQMITAVMPVIATVFAATIVIKWGMKFVKNLFSKTG